MELLPPRYVEGAQGSTAYFGEAGQTPVTRAFAEDNHPFNLEDATRINEVGELTREFIVSFEQIVTSRNIIQDADRFFIKLRPLNIDDIELIKQIGVLQDKTKDQAVRVLPTRLIEIAEGLKALQVKEFGEAGTKGGLWTPDWVIERFPQLTY